MTLPPPDDGRARSEGWPYAHEEPVGPGRALRLRMSGPWIFEGEETFPALAGMRQRVQIGDFDELGRGLVLDGQVQLTERTDALYTTALVFPAALRAEARRRWLIVGGGDGAAAREALRFRDTESVELVDISAMVIEATQRLVPSFWQRCQEDPRLHVRTADAWEILRRRAEEGPRADVVIFDLTDPEDEESPPGAGSSAEHLYGDAAFALAARALAPGGVFVAQLQELSLLRHLGHARRIAALRRAFRHVASYRVFVECFGCWESFALASNDEVSWSPLPRDPIAERLASLYDGDARDVWSARWHEHLFTLPPGLEARLASAGAHA